LHNHKGFVVARNFAAAVMTVCAALACPPTTAHAQSASPGCHPKLAQIRFASPLLRVARKLRRGDPIVIVAIGSSSTAGAGASSPAASYPSKLQEELRRQLKGHSVTVINQGVNGEEVTDMLKRFDTAVVAAKPDLVLWQLGTNSVIRDHPLADHGAAIRAGLNRIRATGADAVLIDPQFAPKVIAKPDAALMVALIALTAKREDVDLFPRFDFMRRWFEVDHLAFTTFVSADGLHMNDWSYACLAKGLGMAIHEAATRAVLSADRHAFSD
jgi:lysophospholipase L1-like esterase